jgi:hypothetical protein
MRSDLLREPIEVILQHDQDVRAGMISFDGRIVEFFGFREADSARVHVRQVERVDLDLKGGMLSTPTLTLHGRLGSLGYTQAIDPREEEEPQLEKLAAAIEKAASRYPEEVQ